MNVSMRIVNDKYEAEDVLQESFVKAFQSLDKFRNESTFGSWMKRIVINGSINQVKKKKLRFVELNERLPVEESEELQEDIPYTVRDVHEAVKRLADGFRIVFSLYMFEDLSHKEIAAQLGISESTSKSQLSRARKQLRELLIQAKDETRQA